jgi:predicted esterase
MEDSATMTQHTATDTELVLVPSTSTQHDHVGSILMIHGWAQNAFVMRNRTKQITKKLNHAGYDCYFLDGPHILPMSSGNHEDRTPVELHSKYRENARAWFLYSSHNPSDVSLSQSGQPMEYIGLNDAILTISSIIEKIDRKNYQRGGTTPISLLGFSQGAVLVHILVALGNKRILPFNKIVSAIMISGFPAVHRLCSSRNFCDTTMTDTDQQISYARTYPVCSHSSVDFYTNLSIRSLHVIGKYDTSVCPCLSEQLADCFMNSCRSFLYHEKGHMIPQRSSLCADIVEFLRKNDEETSLTRTESSCGMHDHPVRIRDI